MFLAYALWNRSKTIKNHETVCSRNGTSTTTAPSTKRIHTKLPAYRYHSVPSFYIFVTLVGICCLSHSLWWNRQCYHPTMTYIEGPIATTNTPQRKHATSNSTTTSRKDNDTNHSTLSSPHFFISSTDTTFALVVQEHNHEHNHSVLVTTNDTTKPIHAMSNLNNEATALALPLSDPPTLETICEKSKHSFKEASGLAVIVTGMERSGTTIVSRLIMSHPTLMGGFEGGVLLGSSPADFEHIHPFYEWMTGPQYMWNLTSSQRNEMVHGSSCHAEMYHTLRQKSPLFSQGRQLSRHKMYLVDKTPRYVYTLPTIMERAPEIPVVVMERDYEELVEAWARRGVNETATQEKRNQFRYNLESAQTLYPDRIHVVNVTRFYQDPNQVMSEVFTFLNLTWNETYLGMEAYNAKLPRSLHQPPFSSHYYPSSKEYKPENEHAQPQ